MKKFLKIFGLVVLLLAIAVSALAAWQWKYVSALIDGLRYDEAAIGEKKVEETEKTVSEVNNYFSVDIRELTPEEEEKIANGELSQTEILAKIISDATGVPLTDESESLGPTAENAPEPEDEKQTDGEGTEASGGGESSEPTRNDSSAEAEQPAAQSADVIVANSVNKLYGLQSSYNARLAGLIGRARAYYDQQKASVGKAAARASVISAFSGEVASMESSCDASVEAVLSDLTAQLNAIGADTSIVSTLRSAYNSEKSAQRAAYVSKYMK